MSILILEKERDCSVESLETTVAVDNPTQFLLRSNDSINGTIYFNGTVVASLSISSPVYYATAVGDYTIRLVGQCKFGQIWTSDISDLSSILQDVTVQDDCAGTLVPAEANRRVSIVGSERTLNVRVVEQCTQLNDFETACASDDGRIILINTTVTPPTLMELDGTAVPGGVTAVSCDVEYVTLNKCFEDIVDSTIRFTQVVTYPVGAPGDATIIWIDVDGEVVAEPVNITECISNSCDVKPASGIVCYTIGEDMPGGCGTGNNFTDVEGVFQTNVYIDGTPYQMDVTVAGGDPATVSTVDEDCGVDAGSPPAPHPSYLEVGNIDTSATLTLSFTPSLPVSEEFNLTFLDWSTDTVIGFSNAPDSSTPDVGGGPRIFTWNDSSDVNGLVITVSNEFESVFLASEFPVGSEQETREAFVFHDCNDEVTYRDTVTNELVVDPSIVGCNVSESLPDQTHELSHGTNTNIPAGTKSVVIVRLTGTVTIDGSAFQLGADPLPSSITYEASQVNGARGLLPEIVLSGGTWMWSAVLPILEQ